MVVRCDTAPDHALDICGRHLRNWQGEGGRESAAAWFQERCKRFVREQAVDAVEVAREDLDVERMCQVGWVDEGIVMGRGGGDVHPATGEGVREHRDHGDEVARIGGRTCSGESGCVGVPLAQGQKEGRAWGREKIVGDEGVLGFEV